MTRTPTEIVAAQLRLTDPGLGVTILVRDNDPGDSNPSVGLITYTGPVGANWTLNVIVGLTKPFSGDPTSPHMDVDSTNSSAGGGTLVVEFTDTGFGPLPAASVFTASVGGTTDGTETYTTFLDETNIAFGTATPLTSLGPFGPGAFDGTISSAPLGPVSAYSLTERVEIAHTAGGHSGFGAELKVPPGATQP